MKTIFIQKLVVFCLTLIGTTASAQEDPRDIIRRMEDNMRGIQ